MLIFFIVYLILLACVFVLCESMLCFELYSLRLRKFIIDCGKWNLAGLGGGILKGEEFIERKY